MEPRPTPRPSPELSSLGDPLRRRLFEHVAASAEPVSRDDAATAAGISRTLAAYHLDRLVESGLLVTAYARPAGRTGPGAGRPAKLYSRAQDEVALTIPPRDYRLLADLLATAAAADRVDAMAARLAEAAREEGSAIVQDGAGVLAALAATGYQPVVEPDGDVTLRNCPFHRVARRQTRLVCSMNQALIQGMLTGSGEDPERAELASCPDRCCVVIHPEPLTRTS